VSGSETTEPTRDVPLSGASASLEWNAPKTLKVGDSTTVQLKMRSGQPVTSLPVVIGFDKKVWQVTNIDEGDFLKRGGAKSSFASRVNQDGQILMTGTRSGGGGATGVGNIASITFKAISPSNTSNIELVTAAVTGVAGAAVELKKPDPLSIQVVGE
jgi:general secretion pathway protein D